MQTSRLPYSLVVTQRCMVTRVASPDRRMQQARLNRLATNKTHSNARKAGTNNGALPKNVAWQQQHSCLAGLIKGNTACASSLSTPRLPTNI